MTESSWMPVVVYSQGSSVPRTTDASMFLISSIAASTQPELESVTVTVTPSLASCWVSLNGPEVVPKIEFDRQSIATQITV